MIARCVANPRSWKLSQAVPSSSHPTPYILHPTPYTLHPTPCTIHPLYGHSTFVEVEPPKAGEGRTYRGTSLIRNDPRVGHYSGPKMPSRPTVGRRGSPRPWPHAAVAPLSRSLAHSLCLSLSPPAQSSPRQDPSCSPLWGNESHQDRGNPSP